MMGPKQEAQAALFYEFSLEAHVPQDHLLRSINRFVDLSDIRQYLAEFQCHTGRPSIDLELLIRMLLIGYCFGIRSERRLCEDFVDALVPVRMRSSPLMKKFHREHRAKTVPPKSDSIMRDVDPKLVQDILNLTQAQRETDIVHHGYLDDLGAGFEIFEGGTVCSLPQIARDSAKSSSSSDKSAELVSGTK